MHRCVLLCLALVACNKTDLEGLSPGTSVPSPEVPTIDSNPGDDGSTDSEVPSNPPPPGSAPTCADVGPITSDFTEIWVVSNENPYPTVASGTIQSPVAGYFHIYDRSIAESGATQWNETGMVRVRNSENPEGFPFFANCGSDYVVPDPDNAGPLPAGSKIYVGTYWLEEGSNTVELIHYCPTYRSGSCGEFHSAADANSLCTTTNPNSVHLAAEGLCLVEPDGDY